MTHAPPIEGPVVALVASAGGIDALRIVLGSLPLRLAAPVVVLQHAQPDRRSRLVEVLARSTALDVRLVEDGARLAPGAVLVAPSGHHTMVLPDGCLALIASGDFPPYRPSADLLLTSLATACGSGALAAVLTGFGHDGAAGMAAIRRMGGTGLASDEETSAVFDMPRNAADVAGVRVLPLRAIGPAIVERVGRRSTPGVAERVAVGADAPAALWGRD